MSTVWRIRLASLGAMWVVTVAALALMDMRPAVVALAAITGVVGAVLFLALDLGDLAAPVDWRAASDGGSTARGADSRVRMLRRQIADGRALEGTSALHRSLVDLVDDALMTHHGIDRTMQPEQARRVLGADLVRLVEGAGASATLADPAQLARLLDHLEALVSDASVRPVTQERA